MHFFLKKTQCHYQAFGWLTTLWYFFHPSWFIKESKNDNKRNVPIYSLLIKYWTLVKKVWNIGMQPKAIPLPIAVLGHILYINNNYFIGWRPQWRNIAFDERDFKIKILSQSICFCKLCQHHGPSYFFFFFLVAKGEGLGVQKKQRKLRVSRFLKLFSQYISTWILKYLLKIVFVDASMTHLINKGPVFNICTLHYWH